MSALSLRLPISRWCCFPSQIDDPERSDIDMVLLGYYLSREDDASLLVKVPPRCYVSSK